MRSTVFHYVVIALAFVAFCELVKCSSRNSPAPVTPSPVIAAPVVVLVTPDAAAITSHTGPCEPSLCGLDNYCACHTVGGQTRCWSSDVDCVADAACCQVQGTCHGMVADACTTATHEAFMARHHAATTAVHAP